MNYSNDIKKLQFVDRKKYIEVYRELGKHMYTGCYIPNVADFANAYGPKNGKSKDALKNIEHITTFTDNTKDIEASVKRKVANYSEEESSKFMKSVIAANVSDITASGFFWKKLCASCDNMKIDIEYDDCRSKGDEITLPIDEETYNFKVRNHFINELNDYTENYDEFLSMTSGLTTIHVRSFLTCNHSKNHRRFCKKCAGIYRREHNSTFMPKNIGIYSTFMITEHATQASLDSMNNGVSEKLNVLLEQPINSKELKTYADIKNKIKAIIDQIGAAVGVESRFYEIALLSRIYLQANGSYEAAPLVTSFLRQKDEFGAFIYKPTEDAFMKLLGTDKIDSHSIKSNIAFDIYD